MDNNDTRDWTLDEETFFGDLMQLGNLTRIQAIQLYCRMKHDPEKCVRYLTDKETK